MLIELTQKDLVNMVSGVYPHESIMNHWMVEGRGKLLDESSWYWNKRILSNLNEQELWDLYVLCKDSWETKNPS